MTLVLETFLKLHFPAHTTTCQLHFSTPPQRSQEALGIWGLWCLTKSPWGSSFVEGGIYPQLQAQGQSPDPLAVGSRGQKVCPVYQSNIQLKDKWSPREDNLNRLQFMVWRETAVSLGKQQLRGGHPRPDVQSKNNFSTHPPTAIAPAHLPGWTPRETKAASSPRMPALLPPPASRPQTHRDEIMDSKARRQLQSAVQKLA